MFSLLKRRQRGSKVAQQTQLWKLVRFASPFKVTNRQFALVVIYFMFTPVEQKKRKLHFIEHTEGK